MLINMGKFQVAFCFGFFISLGTLAVVELGVILIRGEAASRSFLQGLPVACVSMHSLRFDSGQHAPSDEPCR